MEDLNTYTLNEELDELAAREDDDDDPLGDDERERLAALRELSESVDGWPDATLIHESNFEDYARRLAEDTGAVPDSHSWPLTCIDWAQAAHELSADFTSIDFDGESYYVQ